MVVISAPGGEAVTRTYPLTRGNNTPPQEAQHGLTSLAEIEPGGGGDSNRGRQLHPRVSRSCGCNDASALQAKPSNARIFAASTRRTSVKAKEPLSVPTIITSHRQQIIKLPHSHRISAAPQWSLLLQIPPASSPVLFRFSHNFSVEHDLWFLKQRRYLCVCLSS